MKPAELAHWGANHLGSRWSGREKLNGDDSPWHLVIRAEAVVGDGRSREMQALLAAVRASGPCRVTLHTAKGDALAQWLAAGCPA